MADQKSQNTTTMAAPDGDTTADLIKADLAGDVVEPQVTPAESAPTPEPASEPTPPAEPAAASATADEDLPDFEVKAPATPSRGGDSGISNQLLDIKNKALEELRPLVDKLELNPVDKFQLLLKIIRATDDQDLVQDAYEAAKAIEDENERAEALVDVVNEIDYFATKKSS